MKKRWIILFFFAILLAAAAITNPPVEAHKTRLRKEVKDLVASYKLTEGNPFLGYAGYLTDMAIDLGLDQVIEVDNYFFFGLSRIKLAGIDKPVAIGIFGQVYMFRSLKDVVADPTILLR